MAFGINPSISSSKMILSRICSAVVGLIYLFTVIVFIELSNHVTFRVEVTNTSIDVLSLSSTNFKIAEPYSALLETLIDEDSAVVTILCGEDIKEREMEKIKKEFEKKYEFVDLDIRKGEQPVYSFIIGVE